MYIGIKDNKIFDIVSNLVNKRDPTDPTVVYVTFEYAIENYSFDQSDFKIDDTIIPSHLKDSLLRSIGIEWSKWTEQHYEYIVDFEKTRRGYKVLHSNTTAEITIHFKPPQEGNYKILFGHGSTIASIIDAGTLNVGYIRANDGVDLQGYIAGISFPLENGSDTSQLNITSTEEFEVLDDNELIVVSWIKTEDEGSGYLYLLTPILRRIS